MNVKILRILLLTFYFAAAFAAYLLDFYTLLNILAMPWSVFLIIIGGLFSHSLSGIDVYLDILKIFAVMLNIALYLASLKVDDRGQAYHVDDSAE
jgi:hypothetical protein